MNDEKLLALEYIISKNYANIAGIVVLKEGKNVYEKYFNEYTSKDTLHVFSVTKSLISLLIGIAIDQGFIKSIDQKVLEFFPEYVLKRGEKTIKNISIKDLLTMTAPYKFKSAPYTKYFTSEDWVKSALDLLGGKGTIGDFRYTPLIGPDILSGIIVKATGKSVLEFAKENLFIPLEMTELNNLIFKDKEEQFAFIKSKKITGWVSDPMGVNTAGWGLTLSPMDMAKIGQLYLNRGIWKDQRIISDDWIDESTQQHSFWNELQLKYGLMWWILEDHQQFAAMGDGGNTIFVSRKHNMVVAIASSFKPIVKDRIALILESIIPLFCE